MRTKTLLLAGAALALSLATSQAQVYSANIVGYANVPMVTGYNMVANQFSNGANTADVVLTSLPDGTFMETWNGTGYTISIYDTGSGSTTPALSWYMSDYSTPTNPPTLNPGLGFFLLLPSPTTNTFVGSVVPNINGFTTNHLVVNYNLVGSTVPLAAQVVDPSVNLLPPDGTFMETWNGNGYTTSIYDTGSGSTTPALSWYMSDYSTSTNPPTLKVGQGFFLLLPSSYAWTQTLTP